MDSDDRRELAAQLFALLTATLEDAAALALEGQGGSISTEYRMDLAAKLRTVGGEVLTVANAVALILKR